MSFNEGEKAYIVENNSHVTPVRIIRKDGEFYTIQFANFGRISLRGSRLSLRGSRLYHTEEEAQKKIRPAPSSNRQVIRNGYKSPYNYNNSRSPYGI